MALSRLQVIPTTSRIAMLAVTAVLSVLLGQAFPAAADTRVDGPIRFEVSEDDLLEVNGDARYLDTIELRHTGSGPVLVNVVSMDDYVAGIAEMPASWPMEALKAQAVAARTYAWYVADVGSYDGYDICATTACQVFQGADAVLGSAAGDRWRDAVDSTAGEVLTDIDGQPILARYFSTSGGQTSANEQAFPSSGPREQLVAIDDPYDEVSPFHRWTVTFTREEFDTILARGDTLGATVPVDGVERVGATDDPAARIAVTGRDGTQVDVDARDFQRFVSSVAPQSFPARFPQLRDDEQSLLPSTVPSSRFAVRVTETEVILDGQGWGHGVGLGQYGARGRADAGHDYRRILAAYYNGASPGTTAALPERIRVGLGPADDVSVLADRLMQIASGDELIEAAALGTWTAVSEADGWLLRPPDGHDQPLAVSQTRSAPNMDAFVDAVAVEVDVNKPVLLDLEVTDADGNVVLTRPLGVAERGTHAAVWRLEATDGSLVPPGAYRVALIAEDQGGDRDGTAIPVTLPLEATASIHGEPTDATPPAGADTNRWRIVVIVVAVGALTAAGALVLRRA